MKTGKIGKSLDEALPEEIRGVFNKATASSDSSEKRQNSKGSDGGEFKSGVSKTEQEKPNIDGGNTMADDKTIDIELVKATVAEMMKQKDAEASIAKVISDKDAEIASLTAAKATLEADLSGAKATGANLSSELETVKTEVETLKAQATTLASEKETAQTLATAAQAKLDQIEAEKTLAVRTEVLTTAGALMPEGEMRTKQVAKITGMSQEDFEGYVAELSAISTAAKLPFEKQLTPEEKKAADDKAAEDAKKTKCKASLDESKTDLMKRALASTPDVSNGNILARTIANANSGSKGEADMVTLYAGI
jgi:hypothetical protein